MVARKFANFSACRSRHRGLWLDGASAQAQKAYYQGKTVLDPQFHKEYKKFTADEPTPLMAENHEQAINEIPRETEVVEIFKQIIRAGPLPSRR